MKAILKISLFFIFSFFTLVSFAETPGQMAQALFKKMYTVQANFSEQLYNSKGKRLQQATGFMWIKKPGKFRWQLKSPTVQLFIANGKTLWAYDPALKQASKQSLSKSIGSTPASILSGASRALTNYFITQYYQGWYVMRPRYGGSEFQYVKLKFNGDALSQMIIVDKLGQQSRLQFSNVKINQSISDSLFNFSPPKGTDVIQQK